MSEPLTILAGQLPVMLDLNIPLEWLSYFVAFFPGSIVVLLVYIAIYIIRELRKKSRYEHLIKIYSNFIGDIIMAESDTELEDVLRQPYVQSIQRRWLDKPYGREVLIEQLVQNHKSLTGKAGENLVWLYNGLKLHEDSLAALSSSEWHMKASGMQQLAEMQQKEYLKRLYKETNAGVYLVRAEAQIAVVKLSGFSGLRFLNVISQPITQWQQICLLNKLPPPDEEQEKKIFEWLMSGNDSIVEFSLRLISKFQLTSYHDSAIVCLSHRSEQVRLQAIQTLRVIATDQTADLLIRHFENLGSKEQSCILEVIAELGTVSHLPFLETVTRTFSGIRKQIAEKSMNIIKSTAGLGWNDENQIPVLA